MRALGRERGVPEGSGHLPCTRGDKSRGREGRGGRGGVRGGESVSERE